MYNVSTIKGLYCNVLEFKIIRVSIQMQIKCRYFIKNSFNNIYYFIISERIIYSCVTASVSIKS